MEEKNQQPPPPGGDFTKKVEETFEELKGEANKHWEKFEKQAEGLMGEVEEKAGELLKKAESGELTKEAKEKLSELAEEAKKIWKREK